MLPYLDDFMFMERGFWQCVRLARRAERDPFQADFKINVPKSHTISAQQRRQLGFDVEFAAGEFRVPEDRWDALWRWWVGCYPPTMEEWWPAQ